MATLTACQNKLCRRKVSAGSAFCCSGCRAADELHYEVHEDGPLGHSEGCDERMAERGEWTQYEADYRRAMA